MKIKSIIFIITAIILIQVSFAQIVGTEGERLARASINISYQSKLELPTEGERVSIWSEPLKVYGQLRYTFI